MIKRLLLFLVAIPLLFIGVAISIAFTQQDLIVKKLITSLNEDFYGEIVIEDSHIAPFENFPYISIDLEELKIYADKNIEIAPIIHLEDTYVGFNLWDIIQGDFDIKTIKLQGGFIHLIQDLNGNLNITKVFETNKKVEEVESDFNLHLKQIEINDVDVNKLNEATNTIYDAFIVQAKSGFKSSGEGTFMHLDSKFELSIIQDIDTTFVNHKHFDLNTDIAFLSTSNTLEIKPSKIYLEGAEFNMKGDIDFNNDVFLDLNFHGEKPNFDLFIAFAPEELIPTLESYKNEGKVYFDAIIKGKSIHGNNPKIDVEFGCSEAYFTNSINLKKLDELQFKGHFSNGSKRDLSTMEFSLQNFSAKPETGVFSGNLFVKNFEAPEIEMKLISQLELDFLSKFLNLEDLQDLKGKVKLTMNFRDIIDLENPERSIEKLNESYYTELEVENLSFKSPDYHLPIEEIDISATLEGEFATIKHFKVKAGKSDIQLKGTISDLPAIIHHSSKEVSTDLIISSSFIDLHEITNTEDSSSVPIDESIKNLEAQFQFKSSARALTESPNLPVGEFFIQELKAELKHYPHVLHDFYADVIIDQDDFEIVDFKGEIDQSDFHISGKLSHYDLWFSESPRGDTKLDFNFNSDMLKLEDLFVYKGEQYVPEDYRHEEFDKLKLHGVVDLHFQDSLQSTDLVIDKLGAKMKVHPMRFRDFSGRVHFEQNNLTVEEAKGSVGKSDFILSMNYFLGSDSTLKKQGNYLSFESSHLDIDQLTNYNPLPSDTVLTEQSHDSVFNIYTLAFPNMSYDLKIHHLNYHRYKVDDFYSNLRTTSNHYLHIDTMSMKLAGGAIGLKGYFNGSNPDLIYFSPELSFDQIDIDQLLFKFENFGQDYVVNDQLHGKITGKLYGKLHMHTDLVPSIDDSEIHMDIEVIEGRLVKYGPMEYIADYFNDKNLEKVLFDTLRNHIDMKAGVLNVPNMLINSSLGFIEISGEQDTEGNFEYYLRIPWSMVREAGRNKLFGRKDQEVDPESEDEIIYKDESKNIRYVNVKMVGDSVDFKVSLGKRK